MPVRRRAGQRCQGRSSILDPVRAAGASPAPWGTDRDGRMEDLRHVSYPLRHHSDWPMWQVVDGERDYALTADMTSEFDLQPEHPLFGVRSRLVLPLMADREILGVICVDNLLSERAITENDVAMLIPFAEEAAIAIQNARLFDDLHRAQDALIRSEKL